MPYRVKLNKIEGKDDGKKEIDIVFPTTEGLAEIFPREKIFSSDKLIIAILKALKVNIDGLTAYVYDETRVTYPGVHLVKILYEELKYLHDIKNYESRWKVEWSTEQY